MNNPTANNVSNKYESLASGMSPVDWRGNLTEFPSFFGVFPAHEFERRTWDEICDHIAGNVTIGPDKALLPFFVPCLLQDAPFTEQTLPKALDAGYGNVGKQRSAAHMTEATWLVMDIDGLDKAAFLAKLNALKDTGCAFIVYSTHSHGREDKPGVRVRLAIPIDRSLCAEKYERAWLGLDLLMFAGEVAKADSSGRHLWQQQGVWATSEDRRGMAFSKRQDGAVWSADALIAAAPLKQKPTVKSYQSIALSPTEQAQKLEKALPWINAEDTPTWIRAVTAFKAVAPVIGFANALELTVRYSEQGSDEAQQLNDSENRYNPVTFFDNVKPTMPPEAGLGVLFGLAKDGALNAMFADRGMTTMSVTGHAAAVYLCQHHRKLYDELKRKEAA